MNNNNTFINSLYPLNNISNTLNKSSFPLINNYKTIQKNGNDNNNKTNINYLYLKYKGETNNKGFNKITYIEINPHNIISSLKEISKKERFFKEKICTIIKRQIKEKNYNSNNSNKTKKSNSTAKTHTYNYNYYYEKIFGNNEDINNNKCTFVYDEFLLPDKNNKYNYSIHNIFLFDIINKVFKRMVELHDNNNKIITEDEIIKEYNKQINKLKKFFYNKSKINEKNLNYKDNNKKDDYTEIESNNKGTIYKNIFKKKKIIKILIMEKKMKMNMNMIILQKGNHFLI